MQQRKCSCQRAHGERLPPICEHCKEIRRRYWKEHYTTEGRRERAMRERMGIAALESDESIAHAEKFLSRKPVKSCVTWLELSAGRSNS